METAFSLGRTGETTSVRLLRKWHAPGGATLLPGERVSVSKDEATVLCDEGFAIPDAATPSKSPDKALHNKMQASPGMKKGQHGQ